MVDKMYDLAYSVHRDNGSIKGDKAMTQLIAAICENGSKVITVSDRMVSTGDMTLAFEHPRMKAIPISSRAIVLTAGTVHEPDLLEQAKEESKGKEKILDIAEVLKKVYQEIREKHVVDEVLRPLAGFKSFSEWHARQTQLHDSLVMQLNDGIAHYGLNLTLILAGVDDRGHIIRIEDPGAYRSYDNLTYCCCGMGDRHADNVFAWYRYSDTFPLVEALFIAFEAKKRSEMAGGVGRSTDIVIIDKKGLNQVTADTIDAMEEIHNERESRSERGGFDKKITELNIQTNPLAT
ncbi:MAG: hypothetical protein HY070_12025 [Chloroflexi bacterium]|nr:hypothetical protein [Chloroflexota bacterium]